MTSMIKLLAGVAALPLLAGVAFAQPSAPLSDRASTKPVQTAMAAKKPMQLTEKQMDKVSAGWTLLEVDIGNTSITAVSVWQPDNHIECASCYLNIYSPALSIASIMPTIPSE